MSNTQGKFGFDLKIDVFSEDADFRFGAETDVFGLSSPLCRPAYLSPGLLSSGP